MRILGVDPGTLKMGYGIVDTEDDEVSLVSCGVLTAPQKSPLPERLHQIYSQLLEVMERWHPSALAVEAPFVSRNPKTALAIGQAQGVAFIAAARGGLEVSTYSPRVVKQAITSFGGASKEQVQEMVRIHLGMESLPEPLDAADALAVAICHTRHIHAQALLEHAGERA